MTKFSVRVNKEVLLFFLLFMGMTVYGQRLNTAIYCTEGVAEEVCLFNKTVRHFGDADTITYTAGESGFTYTYNGERLVNWQYKSDNDYGTRLLLRRTKIKQIDQFLAVVPTQGKANRVYERVINPGEEVYIYKKYEEINGLPIGDYLALDEAKMLLSSGRYHLKDTLLTTREKTFDPTTYQEVVKETTVDQLSVKTGVWKYADKPGESIREENYDARSAWASPYNGAELCALFNWGEIKERNYYKASFNRIPTLVRLFNYIAGSQGLPEYISYDVTRHGVTYYHNGQIVAGPQLRNEREIHEVLREQLPEGMLTISYRSNEFDAFQPKGSEPKFQFTCYLPKTKNKGIKYTLNNERFEVAEATPDGKKGNFTATDCSGNILIRGFYRAPRAGDEGVEMINPETYETMITLPNEFKCGNWIYYSEDGRIVKEMNWGECD